mgnify:CR=1 FL=1
MPLPNAALIPSDGCGGFTGGPYIFPLNNPLAARDTIDLAEAVNLSFVSLQRGSAIHGFMENIVAEMGVSLDTRIQVSGFDTMCRLVEVGVGVGDGPAEGDAEG